MSKVKDPLEKKRLAYARDTVVVVEYPHAKRNANRRFKRRLHKVQRQRERRLTDQAVRYQMEDIEDSFDLDRKEELRSMGLSMNLGEVVEYKLESRIERAGSRLLRGRYCACERCRDDERWAAFLTHTLKGTGRNAQKIAAVLQRHLKRKTAAMQAFLTDRPEWQAKLNSWFDKVEVIAS